MDHNYPQFSTSPLPHHTTTFLWQRISHSSLPQDVLYVSMNLTKINLLLAILFIALLWLTFWCFGVCYLSFLSPFWHLIYLFLFRSLFLALSNKCSAQSCFSSELTERLVLNQNHTSHPTCYIRTTITIRTRVNMHEGSTFSKLSRKLVVLKGILDWRTKCNF